MSGNFKLAIQKLFHRFGYHIRRLDLGVDLNDPMIEQVRLVGKDAKVIFEVGAADGRDCQTYAGLFPKAKIYAFEPVPESFKILQSRVPDFPSIIPFNEAMSDVTGTAEFHIATWNDASSLLPPKATGSTSDAYTASRKTIKVTSNTIDCVCENAGVDRINLLKMDAQGAELKILKGATKTLMGEKIDVCYTEVLFLESYENAARFDQIMSFMLDHGFRFHNLYGLAHNQKGELTHADAIFVHRNHAR